MQPCLGLIDAIQFIPHDLTLQETSHLTDQLFRHNSETQKTCEDTLSSVTESLLKYQNQ